VRIDSSGHAVGGTLVDTNLERSPPQLCRHWSVSFLQTEKTATALVFFFDKKPGTTSPVASYKVFGEDGISGQCIQVPNSLNFLTAFKIPASMLQLGGIDSGSIELDLSDDFNGNIATVLTTDGGFPVLVPGVCEPARPSCVPVSQHP
jgi:hypothetical protein